jgi:Protein of unknown function (DUF2959)
MNKTTIHFPLAAAITFAFAGAGAPATAFAQAGPEQEAKAKVDEMNAAADIHFAAWKNSTIAISDPALRKKGEERLAGAQAQYQKIAATGRDARQYFDTLMTDLKNQTSYMGSQLNPSGISSLKPEAAKFNTRARELFGKIDMVNKALGDYATSIRP